MIKKKEPFISNINRTTIVFHTDDETMKKLDDEGNDKGMTRSQMIRWIVKEWYKQ